MTAEFDLSGFGLRLTGDDPLVGDLAEQWAAFRGIAPRRVLDVRMVAAEGRLPHARRLEGGIEETQLPGGRRLARVEGSIELGAPGAALLRIPEGDPSRRLWGAINLLVPALGTELPRHGGLLLHAAGAVIEGRAFVLPGASGAGKSTWAAACAAARYPILSDDTVLLDLSAEGPAALGSPLRARDFPAPGCGRWPIAALLLGRHGEAPALGPTSRLRALAVLRANALFVSVQDTALEALLDDLLARVPVRELTFAPDPSFVPLLRSFDAAAR